MRVEESSSSRGLPLSVFLVDHLRSVRIDETKSDGLPCAREIDGHTQAGPRLLPNVHDVVNAVAGQGAPFTGCRVVTYELAGPEDRLPCPKVKVSGLARLDFLGCPGPCARRDERWNADQDSDPRNDAAPVYVESVVSTRTRCHGVLLPKMAAPELRSAATEQSASAVWVHEA